MNKHLKVLYIKVLYLQYIHLYILKSTIMPVMSELQLMIGNTLANKNVPFVICKRYGVWWEECGILRDIETAYNLRFLERGSVRSREGREVGVKQKKERYVIY